ncbi:MAG: DUF4147 domain-containing protein [Candidatus Cloacimonadaceae bacterium]
MKESLLQILKQTKENFSPLNLLYEQVIHLPFNRPIYVMALGKAAYQMTKAVLIHAEQEEYIRIKGGLIITKHGMATEPLANFTIIESSHIKPDENSLKAGEAAIDFLQSLGEDDILLVLMSGGGTNLMEKPVEGISLEEFNSKISELIKSGAELEELDAERKKMSAVKGGKLLPYIKPKHVYIYAMSDIPGDRPKYICSNPFLPDVEEADDMMSAERFHRFDNLTTDKFMPRDRALTYKIIANNKAFCEMLRDTAFKVISSIKSDNLHLMATELAGDSDNQGRSIAELANKINKERDTGFAAFQTPCLLIFGGLTTLESKGTGKGGRCTELALTAVEGLSNVPDCALLTYATDGLDGIPESAGAVIDNNTKQALQEKGIDIDAYLDNNDSFTALKAVDAIIPGEYTGINVNDIVLLYIN